MSESITTTLRGRVVTPDAVIEDAVVALSGDRISWVGPVSAWPDEAPPQSNSTILPGLVDAHCHGGGGASFPDSARADLMTAVRHHRGRGTTTMLASLVSASPGRLVEQTSMLADLYESGDIAGVHLEGPFLSVARCGAQDPASLRGGDTGLLADIIDAGRGSVRSMTLAPEVDGFTAVGHMLRENGIVPSIGHTDADARTTRSAIEALGEGAIGATHLFNGMPTWHHRSPGPVSECLAAAARGSMVLELIGDGVHLADETVRAVFDLVGGGNIALVSDAGTPTISDPGQHLISEAVRAGIRVESVPGPNAAIAALAVCGFPVHSFCFMGFPPTRSKDRERWFGRARSVGGIVVFYEAPHRIRDTLLQLQRAAGDCNVVLCREMTKIHEELVRGPISKVVTALVSPKGEFTVVVDLGLTAEYAEPSAPSGPDALKELGYITDTLKVSRRRAINIIAKRYHLSPNEVYASIERAKKSVD